MRQCIFSYCPPTKIDQDVDQDSDKTRLTIGRESYTKAVSYCYCLSTYTLLVEVQTRLNSAYVGSKKS
jgi:hypothetical protein